MSGTSQRPHVGHDTICAPCLRKSSPESSTHAASTSRPGSPLMEYRIVSPIPSRSKEPMPALLFTSHHLTHIAALHGHHDVMKVRFLQKSHLSQRFFSKGMGSL